MTHEHTFDHREGDVFWCTADRGWITGQLQGSFIYVDPLTKFAPSVRRSLRLPDRSGLRSLANGGTTVIFEGVPSHPTPARFWEIVDRYAVTQLYTAPRRCVPSWRRATSTSSSRRRASRCECWGPSGSPLTRRPGSGTTMAAAAAAAPSSHLVADRDGLPHAHAAAGGVGGQPGSQPYLGVPALVDDDGELVEGIRWRVRWWRRLAVDDAHHLWGPRPLRERLLRGLPRATTGDWRDDGYYWITGRTDDVINVSATASAPPKWRPPS